MTQFGLIGHAEDWGAAAEVFAAMRGTPLPDDEIRDILPWIPPRPVCEVEITSTLGTKARGVYIDSFIPPDRLDVSCARENLSRVREAAACAINAGARIVSLGGFSSILVEGNIERLPSASRTMFTTGNTLTVAFIVEGIERMCAQQGRDLRDCTLLVIGATGDVGSGCVRCLAPRVKRVLLYARNLDRLRRFGAELEADGIEVEATNDVDRFSETADVVVCAASLPGPSLLLGRIAPDALVCDAGYPKNLAPSAATPRATVFFGGLGQIDRELKYEPDHLSIVNRHPFPNMAHGCLLEGMALALEGRFESFSRGRGAITPERVGEIAAIANRHGIHLAPFCQPESPSQ